MEKVEFKDAEEYEAPGHFGVYTGLLQGELFGNRMTDLEDFWIGVSHFLPGGGCEMGSGDTDKVYYVLDGQVTISTPDGVEYVLEENDSVYMAPGEERDIKNKTTDTATMLVIVSNG